MVDKPNPYEPPQTGQPQPTNPLRTLIQAVPWLHLVSLVMLAHSLFLLRFIGVVAGILAIIGSLVILFLAERKRIGPPS